MKGFPYMFQLSITGTDYTTIIHESQSPNLQITHWQKAPSQYILTVFSGSGVTPKFPIFDCE
jgi:hypothetical protein